MQRTLKNSLVAFAISTNGLVVSTALGQDGFIGQPSRVSQEQPVSNIGANAAANNRFIQQPVAQPDPTTAADGEGQRGSSPLPASAQQGLVSVLELAPPMGPAYPATAKPTDPAPSRFPTRNGSSQPAIGPEDTQLEWLPIDPGRRRTTSRTASKVTSWDELPSPFEISQNSSWQSAPVESLSPGVAQYQYNTSEPAAQDRRIPANMVSYAQPTSAEIARQELAAQISKELLSKQTPLDEQAIVLPADNPEGMRSVGQRINMHREACEALLKRNAFYSARAEAKEAIRFLMRTIDELANRYAAEPSFDRAMRSLEEAEDFSGRGPIGFSNSIAPIVASHECEVLKQADVSNISPSVAADHYRLYATDQLVEASANHPWASVLYYTLGRVYQAEAEVADPAEQANLRSRAVTFYRAAAAVDPQNALALDQLGYVFLTMDRPSDAQEALVGSLRVTGSLSALQNLIEASKRSGDGNMHQWAMQNYQAMLRSTRPENAPPAAPRLTFVTPQQFAAISPRTIGPPAPQGQLPQAPAGGYTTHAPMQPMHR